MQLTTIISHSSSFIEKLQNTDYFALKVNRQIGFDYLIRVSLHVKHHELLIISCDARLMGEDRIICKTDHI